MAHLWVRSETRDNEDRVGVTPEGVAELVDAGFRVTVEEDPTRVIGIEAYRAAGAEVAPSSGWIDAPAEAIVFGLKELPEDGVALRHRHIMFGHAFKGQPDGLRLLERFKAGGGALYDLEYLTDETGRRVAAFGYWAGFAGAAVSLMAFAALAEGGVCPAVDTFSSAEEMAAKVNAALGALRPRVIIIGALGRVGTGARDLVERVGCEVTGWDMAETASGGPFPEILAHEVFLNAILATPGVPVFVGADALAADRALRVIGDIACDPTSDFSPVPIYSEPTSWAAPVVRIHEDPVLDVMAIDNLPSMLPKESSEDFAAQLLPHLKSLDRLDEGVWGRARRVFDTQVART